MTKPSVIYIVKTKSLFLIIIFLFMNSTIIHYNKYSNVISKQYCSIDLLRLQSNLLDFFKGCNSLLEIGSGCGRDMDFLISHGFDVIGIEGSIGMIQESITVFHELKERIFLAELPDQMPEFEYKFDGLYSIATIMHFEIDKLNTLLRKIKLVTKPSAPVFFSVSGKRNKLALQDDRFFIELTKEEWKNIFISNNFEVLKIEINDDSIGRPIKWFSFYLISK